MKRLVLLNGPPRCGKDTAAKELSKLLSVNVIKNTAPMDDALRALFGLTEQEFKFLRERDKDTPQKVLGGLSMRQVLISFSEDWCKPKFGKGFFGTLGTSKLVSDRLNVCSDSGFAEEATEYVAALGASNIMLFHIGRKGTNFDGDSRSYIEVPGVTPIPVSNNTTPEAFGQAIYNHILHWSARP